MSDKYIDPIVTSKTEDDSIKAEVWVVPDYKKEEKEQKNPNSMVLDQRITDLKMQIDEIDGTIYRLENSADGVDYAVAAACGVIAGVLDSIFIDEFSIDSANDWGAEKASKIMNSFAVREGYKGNSFEGSISYLQSKYSTGNSITASPSIFGLISSVVASVAGVTFGMGKLGATISASGSSLGLADRLFRGIVNWGCNAVCGSNGKLDKSSGLPGPIRNMFNKSASINTLDAKTPKAQIKLSNTIEQVLNGSKSSKGGFSLGAQLSALAQIGIQAIPVLINEAVVRAFYFIRRFFMEVSLSDVRSVHDLYKVDWMATLPFGNRTIVRMLSVSTLAMTTVDMAGAAIEAATKSGGNAGQFFSHFALCINYVGLGRTVIACSTDGIMGVKLSKKRKERLQLVNEYLQLNKEKIYYKQKDMWVSAEKTQEVIDEAVEAMKKTDEILKDAIEENKESFIRMSVTLEKAEELNPGLKQSIKDTIKWE